MAYQADIRISVKGGKQIDQLSKAVDKLTPQINAANAAFIRFSKIQRENLPLIANFSRVLRENQKVFASTILSNKEATTAAKNQAIAERELNNELARRNAVLNKARGIKSDPIAKSIARNQAKFRDPSAPAFENLRDQPSGAKRPSRFAQFSQDASVISAPRSPVETKIKSALADIKTEKRVVKEIADIRKKSASRVATHNKRRVDREKQIKAIFKDADKINDKRSKILRQDAKVIKEQIAESAGGRFRRFQRNRTLGDKRIRRDTLSSAAIGGAFPLLFGQGPLAAAGGAAGGFAGGIIGGQAAFALSLVGTQIGSAISQLVSGTAELGKALGPFTQDVQAVTTALGLQGSVQEARINKIEELKGKTAAFIAAQKIMSAEIGQRGVNALKKFGESSRILGSQFALALTKLQAFTAGLFNFINTITGINRVLEQADANRVVKAEAALGDKEAQDLQNRQDAINKKTRGIDPLISGLSPTESIELSLKQKELDIEKKLFAIRKKVSAEVANETTESSKLLAAKEKEVDLNNRVKEIMKRGVNKELAKSLATVEQTFDKEKEVLLEKQKQAKLDFVMAQLDDASKTKQDELKEKLDQITEELGIHNDERLKALGLTEDLADGTDKVAEAFKRLNETIRNDIKEGIKGLIKGTSTLGNLLNNVADRFLDLALNQALFGNAAGEFKKGKGGGIFGAIAGMFRANGGPVQSGKSFIVGERGPELFVPRSSGNIIPNNKLGGGSTNNVVVNVDASGSDVQGDDAAAKELGGLISVAVQSELVKQQRPGGLLSR